MLKTHLGGVCLVLHSPLDLVSKLNYFFLLKKSPRSDAMQYYEKYRLPRKYRLFIPNS